MALVIVFVVTACPVVAGEAVATVPQDEDGAIALLNGFDQFITTVVQDKSGPIYRVVRHIEVFSGFVN